MIHAAICDSCDDTIIGARFKCCMCPDFDLCEKCEKGHSHNPDHIFLKASFSIRNGIPRSFSLPKLYPMLPEPCGKFSHQGKKCDYCKATIIGVRFICMDCTTQTNFCQRCEALLRHADYHVVLKVIFPLPDDCHIAFNKISLNEQFTGPAPPSPPATTPKSNFISTAPPSSLPLLPKYLPLPVSPNLSPNTSPDSSPRISPAITPKVSPNVTPNVTPNVSPKVSPKVSPNVSLNVTPTISPASSPTYCSMNPIPQQTLPSFSFASYTYLPPLPSRVSPRPSSLRFSYVSPLPSSSSLPPPLAPSPCSPLSVAKGVSSVIPGQIDIVVRSMQALDLEEIRKIEVESFPLNSLSSEYFRSALKGSSMGLYVFVAEDTVENCVVGYISSRFKRLREVVRIESLAVSSRHRGKKVGDKLISHCLDFVSKYRKTVTLHVRQQNEVALRLYLKYGFQVVGELKGYYRDEEMICKNSGDAFKMQKICD